jgi:hypothetical protein
MTIANHASRLSVYQLLLAGYALTGITILAALEVVGSDAVIAIYSGIIGAGLATGAAAQGAAASRDVEAARADTAQRIHESIDAANGTTEPAAPAQT